MVAIPLTNQTSRRKAVQSQCLRSRSHSPPLQVRGTSDSLAASHLEGSECSRRYTREGVWLRSSWAAVLSIWEIAPMAGRQPGWRSGLCVKRPDSGECGPHNVKEIVESVSSRSCGARGQWVGASLKLSWTRRAEDGRRTFSEAEHQLSAFTAT